MTPAPRAVNRNPEVATANDIHHIKIREFDDQDSKPEPVKDKIKISYFD